MGVAGVASGNLQLAMARGAARWLALHYDKTLTVSST